jgi:hypothetical protein
MEGWMKQDIIDAALARLTERFRKHSYWKSIGHTGR